MSLDIYIDVSYHLKSQVRMCDAKGLELHAEIETGSGGNSATHHQGGSGGITQEWNRWDGSVRSDGGRGPHAPWLLSPLRLRGPTRRRSMYRRREIFGRATRGFCCQAIAAARIEDDSGKLPFGCAPGRARRRLPGCRAWQ